MMRVNPYSQTSGMKIKKFRIVNYFAFDYLQPECLV